MHLCYKLCVNLSTRIAVEQEKNENTTDLQDVWFIAAKVFSSYKLYDAI